MSLSRPPTEPFELRAVAFTDPDAVAMIAEADAFNTELYGHPDATPMRPEEFDPGHGGLFLIAYHHGAPAACGGYRRADDSTTAELKRLYVRPTARRRGLARRLLSALEEHARLAGYQRVILDVGAKQHPAHALYEAVGYHRIPGFSIYRDSPGNRAYGKDF
jgi:GNAT superfamily N-acetyltransferase